MPFWQAVQRCFNCKHWRSADHNDTTGLCHMTKPARAPFWMDGQAELPPHPTRHDDGQLCPAYVHDKHKPHPLDAAPGIIAGLLKGDVITVRTYTAGHPASRAEATVLRTCAGHIVISLFNAEYRMRSDNTARNRGGTIMGMEEWGLDPSAEVRRAGRPREHMHRATELLRDVRKGDKVRLLGYPPFDGQRKTAHVLKAGPTELVIRCSHGPKLTMLRTGPMAGLIINDPLFVLDTTEPANAEQTDPAA